MDIEILFQENDALRVALISKGRMKIKGVHIRVRKWLEKVDTG